MPSASRRVLVTGSGGQDGSYLCEQLRDEGATVFGMVRRAGAASASITQLEADLRDLASVRRAVDEAAPDEVYHLAAATFVPDSFHGSNVFDVNAGGTANLVDALRASGARPRLCFASSAEIFGAGTAGTAPARGTPAEPQGAVDASRAAVRLSEASPIAPATPYGEAKAHAHRLVQRLREQDGWFACCAILFNHESPRRPPAFVTRRISMAAARIARGLERSLMLGNLGVVRDWGYAPEYVEAMRRMVRADRPRDYVVATGRGATVGDFARLAFERVGLDWREHVTVDSSRVRAGEATARVGDPSRIAEDLGWRAATTLEELVAIMVDADVRDCP